MDNFENLGDLGSLNTLGDLGIFGKDVNVEILLNLDTPSLLKMMRVNKKLKELCDETFWKMRLQRKYPNYMLIKNSEKYVEYGSLELYKLLYSLVKDLETGIIQIDILKKYILANDLTIVKYLLTINTNEINLDYKFCLKVAMPKSFVEMFKLLKSFSLLVMDYNNLGAKGISGSQGICGLIWS